MSGGSGGFIGKSGNLSGPLAWSAYLRFAQMDPTSHDAQLRQAVFSHVDRLAALRSGKSRSSISRHVAGSVSAYHPTFIVGWHPARLRVQLAFGALVGASAQAAPP
jgi:hypothetical protein